MVLTFGVLSNHVGVLIVSQSPVQPHPAQDLSAFDDRMLPSLSVPIYLLQPHRTYIQEVFLLFAR